jgi:hypothetical protein
LDSDFASFKASVKASAEISKTASASGLKMKGKSQEEALQSQVFFLRIPQSYYVLAFILIQPLTS